MEQKLCKDCKYLKTINLICKHRSNGISMIDGEPIARFASFNREDYTKCGPEGNWWESSRSLSDDNKPWYKFW